MGMIKDSRAEWEELQDEPVLHPWPTPRLARCRTNVKARTYIII